VAQEAVGEAEAARGTRVLPGAVRPSGRTAGGGDRAGFGVAYGGRGGR